MNFAKGCFGVVGNVALGVVLCGVATVASAQPAPPASCTAAVPLVPGGIDTDQHTWGASVAIIDSASLHSLGGRTMSEVLTARVPGVSVMRSSGVAGAGSRIRLRGPSGIFIVQEPILFIDGIRVDGELHSITLDAGGQAPSRIDDVPVESVRCVFVLRGPAATAAYGTDAAGGVIHIVTQAPTAGPERVSAFVEGLASSDAGDYPANFGNANICTRARAALGQCVSAPLRTWSPLEANSPFRTAAGVRAGANATIVSSSRLSLAANATGARTDGVMINNDYSRLTSGLSATARPGSGLVMQADAWFMGGTTRLPLMGNPTYAILNSALLGNSVDDPVRRGYRNVPLEILQQFDTEQRLKRFGGVAKITWQPTPWFTLGGTFGREDSRVRDEQTPPSVRLTPGGYELLPNELVSLAERRNQHVTGMAWARADYGAPTFRMSSRVAVDHVGATRRRTTHSFDRSQPSGFEDRSWRGWDESTRGLVVQQSIASSDRRFVTLGLRRDALDRQFVGLKNPTYTFANATWDLGRELDLRSDGLISLFRVRAAYGESGDSRAFVAAIDRLPTVPIPGEPTTPGTPEAEKWSVERAREVEGGIDLSLKKAVNISATYFEKRSTDALVDVLIAPGTGGPGTAVANTATWRTRGTEVAAQARILDRRTLSANVRLSFTSIDNEVETLGLTPSIVGTVYRIQPGYPLFATWGTRYTVTDANSDGVIVPDEVNPLPESRFLGSPVPTRELGVSPSVTIAGTVTIAALVDYRGGHRVYNVGERLRCNSICAALYDPNASLADQARAIDPNTAGESWIEDGTFTRLRELSLTWTLPAGWSRRFGARSSTVTVLGRNLWTGTDYSGIDPETSYTGQTQILQADLFVLPPTRTLSLRFESRW